MLGAMYDAGKGVPVDVDLALRWCRMAADQALPEAQFQLGLMYMNGRGVEKNQLTASYWFNRAARNGNEMAKNMVDRLLIISTLDTK